MEILTHLTKQKYFCVPKLLPSHILNSFSQFEAPQALSRSDTYRDKTIDMPQRLIALLRQPGNRTSTVSLGDRRDQGWKRAEAGDGRQR